MLNLSVCYCKRATVLLGAIALLATVFVTTSSVSAQSDEMVDMFVRLTQAQGQTLSRSQAKAMLQQLPPEQIQQYEKMCQEFLGNQGGAASGDNPLGTQAVTSSTIAPPIEEEESPTFPDMLPFYVPPTTEMPDLDALADSPETTSDKARSWVILYDASAPQAGSAATLACFQDDMQIVYNQLLEAGVDKETIIVLNKKTGADKSDFLAALARIADGVKNTDRITIFFQGYGVNLNGIDYLIPVDFKPGQIASAIETPGQDPADSLIPLSEIYDYFSESKTFAHGLIINAHSAHPADIANVTIADSYPVIPFGTQKADPPKQTMVMISRSLHIMPNHLFVLNDSQASNSNGSEAKLPKISVFQRIVLEGFSSLAEGNAPDNDGSDTDAASDPTIQISEFMQYVQSRSEIQNYTQPSIRLNYVTNFSLLPYYDSPQVVQQVKSDVITQVQKSMFQTGLRIFFQYHDPVGAISVFDNCASILGADDLLQAQARELRNAALAASGDVERAFRASQADGDLFYAFLCPLTTTTVTQGVPSSRYEDIPLFVDKDASEPVLIKKETPKYKTVTQGRGIFARTSQVPDGVTTSYVPAPFPNPTGVKLQIDEIHEYEPGQYRVHFTKLFRLNTTESQKLTPFQGRTPYGGQTTFVKVSGNAVSEEVESNESISGGWVDSKHLEMGRFRDARDAEWQTHIQQISKAFESWLEEHGDLESKQTPQGGTSPGISPASGSGRPMGGLRGLQGIPGIPMY